MDRPSYLSVVLHFVRLGTCCLSQCCRCNTRWTERNMSLFLALQLIVSCLCLVQAEPVLSKERVVMTTSHGDIQLGFYPEVCTWKLVPTKLMANDHCAPFPCAQIRASSSQCRSRFFCLHTPLEQPRSGTLHHAPL